MVAILWKHYKGKDGLYSVKIRHTKTLAGKTKVTYKETGIRLTKKQFSNGRVKDHPKANELNIKLEALCSAPKDQKTFLEFFKESIERQHGYYHKKKLNSVYRIIEEKHPKMTLDWLLSLERSFIKDGKHPNYIADIFSRIRAVVNLMVKSGALDYHKNPFHHFKIKRVKTEKPRISYEELLLLQGVKLDPIRGLARDMYIVSFYQGGMRFGDLCRLNKGNVQKDRLMYTMHKSNNERNLPLNPITEAILKKYNYQFPLNINWKQEDKSINMKNTLMNKHLKAACRFAGIPEISFHTSRHSIADLAVKQKLSSKQLQGILGHSKLTTTESYLKGFYREETDSGLNQLFG